MILDTFSYVDPKLIRHCNWLRMNKEKVLGILFYVELHNFFVLCFKAVNLFSIFWSLLFVNISFCFIYRLYIKYMIVIFPLIGIQKISAH